MARFNNIDDLRAAIRSGEVEKWSSDEIALIISNHKRELESDDLRVLRAFEKANKEISNAAVKRAEKLTEEYKRRWLDKGFDENIVNFRQGKRVRQISNLATLQEEIQKKEAKIAARMESINVELGEYEKKLKDCDDELKNKNQHRNGIIDLFKKLGSTSYDVNEAQRYADDINREISNFNGSIATIRGQQFNSVEALKKELESVQEVIMNLNSNGGLQNLNDAIARVEESKRDAEANIMTLRERRGELEEKSLDLKKKELKVTKDLGEAEEEYAKATKRNADALKGINEIVSGGKGLANSLLSIVKIPASYQDRIYKFGRTLGMNHNQLEAYTKSAISENRDLMASYGLTFDDILKTQQSISNAINSASIMNHSQLKHVAALSKTLSVETISQTVQTLDKFGASLDTSSGYLAENNANAKAYGLEAEKTSKAFADNIKLASQYTFREGINGVSKMTMLSETLRFNLQSIGSVIDRFSTVEDAINTSAKLQVLGGEAAMHFGNPLEMMNMALTDAEGITNKLVDSFKDMGRFNEKTGVVEISPYNKMMMKQRAEALGVSYDEVFNIANQKAKQSHLDTKYGISSKFDDSQKSWLYNNAQIDENGNWYVNQLVGDKVQKVSLNDVNASNIDQIRATSTPQEALRHDVHDIRNFLLGKSDEEAKGRASTAEKAEGLKEVSKTMLAQKSYPLLEHIDKMLGEQGWLYKAMSALDGWVGAIAGTVLAGGLLSSAVRSIWTLGKGGVRLGKSLFGGLFGGAATNTASQTLAQTTTRTLTQGGEEALAQGGEEALTQGASRSFLSRIGARGISALKGGVGGGISAAVVAVPIALYGNASEREEYGDSLSKLRRQYNSYSHNEGLLSRVSNNGASFEEEVMRNKAEAQAKLKYDENRKKNWGEAGGSIAGAALAGAAGGALAGPIGAAIGAVIGGVLGFAGAIAGTYAARKKTTREDILSNEELAQENFEDTKIGYKNIKTRDDLLQSAAVATIGIHDLLISWHNETLDLDRTGRKKEEIEDAINKKDGNEVHWYNPFSWFASGGIVKAKQPKYYAEGAKGTDTEPAWLTPGEMILNGKQQSNLWGIINKKPPYSDSTYIAPNPLKNVHDALTNGLNGSIDVNVNLNVGGKNASKLTKQELLSALNDSQLLDTIARKLDKLGNQRFNGGLANIEKSPYKLYNV